jgi:hypothetical protein
MGKIDDLKKQNPSFTISFIDTFNELFGKSKYSEMVVNLMKDKFNNISDERYSDVYRELVRGYNINPDLLISKDYMTLTNYLRVISDIIGSYDFRTINRFIELNEKKLIEKNDLTSYKTISDLESQISLSELKLIDKEMSKQVLRLLENDDWLVIKPLSYQASLKYGSNTKWCTTSKDSPDYYFRYVKRGILIYCIDKNTGNKVAAFKSIDTSYEPETSFWDVKDLRRDSMELDLPNDVMSVIKDQFTNNKITNWDILTDEERNRQIIFLETYYNETKGYENLPSPELAPRINYENEMQEPETEITETPGTMRNVPIIRLNRIEDLPNAG